MSTYRYDDDDESSDDNSSDDKSSTSSSYSDDYGGDPDWIEKFNLGKSKAIYGGRTRIVETKIKDSHILKSTDWMKKFERTQRKQSSSSSPLPKYDDGKKNDRKRYDRNTNSLKSPSYPDSKQNSNMVRISANEANKTKCASREMNKCSKQLPSRLNDKAERRKRIRQNLKKLKRRERTANNLSSRKGQRKQELQRNDLPTKDIRAEKYEKPTSREMEIPDYTREPFELKNDRMIPMIPTLTNQRKTKNGIDPPEKTRNMKWNDRKIATEQISPASTMNVTNASSINISDTTDCNAGQSQNIDNTRKKQKDKQANDKVANLAQASLSLSHRDVTKSSSIDSELNLLRKAVQINNMDESKNYKNYYGNTSSAQNQHAISPSPAISPSSRIKTVASAAAFHKADFRLNDDVPETKIIETKLHSNIGEIETSVPKNSLGIWGRTVVKSRIFSTPNQNANSLSSGIKNAVPTATRQEVEFHLNDDAQEKQTVNIKLHSSRSEIETNVPKNLFDMWGETVKAKKPNGGGSMMSDKMIRNQADRIKQRIDKARKEAIRGGGHHNEDVGNINDEISIGIKLDPDESASALFFGAHDQEPVSQDSISMVNSAAVMFGDRAAKSIHRVDDEKIEPATKHKSDRDNSVDADAAALFYGVGFAKKTGRNKVERFEPTTNTLDGKDSIDMDDSSRLKKGSDGDNSVNADAAALFYGVGSAKKTGRNKVDRFEPTTNNLDGEDSIDMDDSSRLKKGLDGDNSMDADAAALFYGVGSAKKTGRNEVYKSEPKTDGLDGEDSMDMDDFSRLKKGLDGDNSVDADAAALFYGVGSAKKTGRNDVDKSETKTYDLDREDSIDVDGSSEIKEEVGDNSVDEDAAALFYGVGSAKKTGRNKVDKSEPKANDLDEEDSMDMDDFSRLKKGLDGDNSVDADAAALFYGVGSAKKTGRNDVYKSEPKTYDLDGEDSIDVDGSSEIKEEVGDNSVDEDAAALFYGVGSAKKTGRNDVDKSEPKANDLDGEDSIDVDDSSEIKEEVDGDNLMNADDAALFHGVSFKIIERNDVNEAEYKTNDLDGEDSIEMDYSERKKESNGDNLMNAYDAALFHSMSFKIIDRNNIDEVDYKTNELDGEDSVEMDSATLFDGVDSLDNEANDMNHNSKPEKKVGGENSMSMDNSAAAMFGVMATKNKQRDDDYKIELDGENSMDIAGAAPFNGIRYGKNIPSSDSSSSSSSYSTGSGNDSYKYTLESKIEDLPAHAKTSRKKSWIDDSSRCSSSTYDSVVRSKKLLSSTRNLQMKKPSNAFDRIINSNLKGVRELKEIQENKSSIDDLDRGSSSSNSKLFERQKFEALSPNSSKDSPNDSQLEKNKRTGKIEQKRGKIIDAGKKEKNKKKVGKKNRSKSKDTKKKIKKDDKSKRKKNGKSESKDLTAKYRKSKANKSNTDYDLSFDEDESSLASDSSVGYPLDDYSEVQKKSKKKRRSQNKKIEVR